MIGRLLIFSVIRCFMVFGRSVDLVRFGMIVDRLWI